MISEPVGHLPSGLGIGKLWDLSLSFSEGKGKQKMGSGVKQP